MYEDYVELHKEHRVYANTIVELSMVMNNVAKECGVDIDNNKDVKSLFNGILVNIDNLKNKLINIGNKYLTNNEIDDSKLSNANFMMSITYEYNDLGSEIIMFINNDLTNLSTSLSKANISDVLHKLLNTVEDI